MTFSCKCLYVVCNVLAACMYAWPSFMNACNHAGWICSTLMSRQAGMRGFVLRVVIEQKVRGLLGRSDCTWLTLFKWTPIHNIHDSNVCIYKRANSHTCRCLYIYIYTNALVEVHAAYAYHTSYVALAKHSASCHCCMSNSMSEWTSCGGGVWGIRRVDIASS